MENECEAPTATGSGARRVIFVRLDSMEFVAAFDADVPMIYLGMRHDFTADVGWIRRQLGSQGFQTMKGNIVIYEVCCNTLTAFVKHGCMVPVKDQ